MLNSAPNKEAVARPRLMTRKDAAEYMGVCVKTFDEIRHLFAVDVVGNTRYDRLLMDRHIDLHRMAS